MPSRTSNRAQSGMATRRPSLVAFVAIAVFFDAVATSSLGLAADDGSYGRLDGDVALAVEVGAQASTAGGGLGARLAARYLTMAGLYAGYDDGLGQVSQDVRRRIAGGVELKPLFFGRFASDLERGPATLDLWLDATGIELGIYRAWLNDAACKATCSDHGMEVFLASALPLLQTKNGPFVSLRVGLRWSLADAPGESSAELPRVAPAALLSLGYERLLSTGLVGGAAEPAAN